MFTIEGKYTTAKVFIADQVETACMAQITEMVNHPVFTKPVAIMPDAHSGVGAVVGFTMPLNEEGRVIPNIIGVDIGCGVLSYNVGQVLDIDHVELDKAIRERVPFGTEIHETAIINMQKDFPWQVLLAFGGRHEYSYPWFLAKCKQIGANPEMVVRAIGTLGGGNHFVEIGRSRQTSDIWITVHSGSRNFGKRICDFWQKQAMLFQEKRYKTDCKEEIARIVKETEDRTTIEGKLKQLKDKHFARVPKHLAWLEDTQAYTYLQDMLFAQLYASFNRRIILNRVLWCLGLPKVSYTIESVHNYISSRDNIIRKGAVQAYLNEMLVVPLNMQAGMLICQGKSNPFWNFSAPHGAGRLMSRSQAKQKLTMDNFKQAMTEIYSTSINAATIDEAPGAYKNPEVIMQAIEPTAQIVDIIEPIHNLKA